MSEEQKQPQKFQRNPDNDEVWEDLVEYQMLAHNMTREEAEEILSAGHRKNTPKQ